VGLELSTEDGAASHPDRALQNPRTDAEIIAALDEDVKGSEWILAAQQRQWYEQILWTYGEQNMEWNQRTRRFQARPTRQYIPRSTTNYILPNVEVGIDLFMESLPKPKVVAQTKEDKDRAAADVANGILRTRDDEQQMEMKKHDTAAWTVITGNCYHQCAEDVAGKEVVRVPMTSRVIEMVRDSRGVQVMGPNGSPVTVEKEIPVKDPETGEQIVQEYRLADEGVEVCSPFEIVPDWAARYPWEWRRYTHFRARSRDWIGRVFGSKARRLVSPEKGMGVLGYYQLKVLDIIARSQGTGRLGLPAGGGGSAGDWRFMEDAAVVIGRYMLPSDELRDGRLMIKAGDVILHDGAYPLGSGQLNIHMYRWSVLPGSIFGFGMVRNLMSPQKRLNGIDTQDDLIRKTTGNPAWLVPKRSQFSVSLGTNEPGHVYTYKMVGNSKPERIDGKNPPAHNTQQRGEIITDMGRISGVPDVLRGENPPGVDAGVSLELLTEQAGRRFQPQIKTNRETWRREYMQRLQVAQDSNAWKLGRAIAIIGEDGDRDVKKFFAADFTGAITVEVEAVPVTAFSQALRRINFTKGIEIGLVDIVNSQVNRERGRALYNLSEFEEAFTLDFKRAQMENEALLLGETVEIGPADDDETHAAVHARLIKSRKWDELPETVKLAVLHHFDEHMLRTIPSAPPAEAVAGKAKSKGAGPAAPGGGNPIGEGPIQSPGLAPAPPAPTAGAPMSGAMA